MGAEVVDVVEVVVLGSSSWRILSFRASGSSGFTVVEVRRGSGTGLLGHARRRPSQLEHRKLGASSWRSQGRSCRIHLRSSWKKNSSYPHGRVAGFTSGTETGNLVFGDASGKNHDTEVDRERDRETRKHRGKRAASGNGKPPRKRRGTPGKRHRERFTTGNASGRHRAAARIGDRGTTGNSTEAEPEIAATSLQHTHLGS